MARDEEVVIPIAGEDAGFTATFYNASRAAGSLRDHIRDANRELDRMAQESSRTTRQIDDVTAKLRAAARGHRETAQGSQALNERFRVAQDLARGLGGRYGELAERAGNLGKAFASLGGPGGAALVAAAAIAVTAGAVYKGLEAMRSLVTESREASDGLFKIGLITKQQKDDIESAATAWESLDQSVSGLKATLGAELSDDLAAIAELLGRMARAASDFVEATAPFRQRLADIRDTVTLYGLLRTELGSESETTTVVGALAKMPALTEKFHASIVKAMEELKKAQAEAKRLEGLRLEQQGQEQLGLRALEQAAQKRVEAERQREIEAQAQRLADIDDQAEAQAQAEREKQKAIEATFELQSELQAEATRAQVDQNKRLIEANETYNQASQDAALQTAEIISGLIVQQFGDSKAAAALGVVIQTAFGIANAFAQNPPPSPLGYIGAAQVAAVGAAQGAIIAAQSFSGGGSQKRHIGGVVTDEGSPPPGANPDERLVLAQVGERITDRRSAGARPGGAVVNVIAMDGAWYDAATGRQLRKSGSALNRAVRGRQGQRRFRSGNG